MNWDFIPLTVGPASTEDSPEEEEEVTQRRPGSNIRQRKSLLLWNVVVHNICETDFD